MKCKCSAVIDNQAQMQNLAECVHILGGDLHVVGNTGWVDVEGTTEEIDKYIQLFENYTRHTIATLS